MQHAWGRRMHVKQEVSTPTLALTPLAGYVLALAVCIATAPTAVAQSGWLTTSQQNLLKTIPPLPLRQPKPWHTKTVKHPSTGPEKEWPRILPQQAHTLPQQKRVLPRPKRVAAPKRTKDQPSAAPAPDRDVYTTATVSAAQARCRQILSRVVARTTPEAPIKKGPCGHPAPVKLTSLGAAPAVRIDPPAIVNCDMVEALHTWLTQDLQPLARKHLKSPIVKIRTMSSYSCRNAYGRKNTRLSEHAKANALDIGGFVTRTRSTAKLLAHWGATGRDLVSYRKAEEKRQRLARSRRKATDPALPERRQAQISKKPQGPGAPAQKSQNAAVESEPAKTFGIGLRESALPSLPGLPTRAPGADPVTFGLSSQPSQPSRLGGPKPSSSALRRPISVKTGSSSRQQPRIANTPKAKFLKAAHKHACRLFGTVLGPEANEAHRNHFHVDLAPRKRSNYCR